MTAAWLALLALSLFGPIYAVVMGGLISRWNPRRPATEPGSELSVVVMVPCLNEGVVVAGTVDRLLDLDDRVNVLVLDDASDDETPDILRRFDGDSRVHVLRRQFPDARCGKGAALNAGLQQILRTAQARHQQLDDVVVAVFDADGWADPATLDAVLPWFSQPEVGAVQIGVRINNRDRSWLARMQDVEFAGFTEIFQRARNAITSTGLGGNGQFARLSALAELGSDPWSDCLTEDLDLGLRLRINGHRTIFDGSVAVHQQGLHELSRLIRQRTRWFQGHLQCWDLLPSIWRSSLPRTAKLDMTGHLVLPACMLLLSVGVIAGLLGVIRNLILAPTATLSLLAVGPLVPWWYLFGFAATPLIAAAYWRTEPSIGFWRGFGLAHGYVLYTLVWVPAGWKAVWKQATGVAGWAKTARSTEHGHEAADASPVVIDLRSDIDLKAAFQTLGVLGLDSPTEIRRATDLARVDVGSFGAGERTHRLREINVAAAQLRLGQFEANDMGERDVPEFAEAGR